jgi:hypothetical protein
MTCLPDYGYDDCGFPDPETSKWIYECYKVRTLYILTVIFLDTTLTPLSLLISYKLISNRHFQNVFSAYFGTKIFKQNFCLAFREFIEYTF